MTDYSDTLWNVHTKSNGTLVATSALNTPADFNLERGQSATFNLHYTNESLTIESGETYAIAEGTTEIFTSVNILENGRLENNGTLIETGGDNITILKDYEEHAGSFTTQDTLNNTQLYREHFSSSAIDTLVVGIEPNDSLQDRDVGGVWGLITNAADTRPPPLSDKRYSIEVEILAEYSDYADHTAVENDLNI